MQLQIHHYNDVFYLDTAYLGDVAEEHICFHSSQLKWKKGNALWCTRRLKVLKHYRLRL